MAPNRGPGRLVALVMVATLLGATACGGGGDDDQATGGNGAPSPESSGGEAEPSEGECQGTALEFENLETGVSGTATSALAVANHSNLSQYTAYVGDFDLTEDDVDGWRPTVPEGQNVIAVQVTVFVDEDSPEPAPLEVGAVLDGGDLVLDTHTFLIRHFDSDQDWSQTDLAEGVGGEMTVTAVGAVGADLCFEVEFEDQAKRVSGTVEAPVVREGI